MMQEILKKLLKMACVVFGMVEVFDFVCRVMAGNSCQINLHQTRLNTVHSKSRCMFWGEEVRFLQTFCLFELTNPAGKYTG